MSKLLIFAGTTEGRMLLEALSHGIGERDLTVYACVATEYGKEVIPLDLKHIIIRTGRLTEEEMSLFMKEHQFDYVIDTTHPYAELVSENIRAACRITGCEYVRLLRASSMQYQEVESGALNQSMDQACLFFRDHESVVDYLNNTSGNVLLTIGSKDLAKYTAVKEYNRRLYPRVLPMPEVLESCCELGFSGRQLICMQGPFSAELNVAMMNQLHADYLVTKDSGEAGGFLEKLEAARITGAKLLVIGRNQKEEGVSLEALLGLLEGTYDLMLHDEKDSDIGQWFPLFTNISRKEIVVIGAGKIAKRRIRALLHFDCRIRVVAMDVFPELSELAKQLDQSDQLKIEIKKFEPSDIIGADYVLAATNSRETNQEIYQECKKNKIPVNVADRKVQSDFYFPGIIRKNGITVGVTAEGKNHTLAKKATRAIAECLDIRLQEEK